jgi:hypothetical protein
MALVNSADKNRLRDCEFGRPDAAGPRDPASAISAAFICPVIVGTLFHPDTRCIWARWRPRPAFWSFSHAGQFSVSPSACL